MSTNTRASLDYLITALVRSTGKQEHNGSQFPIYGIDRVGWQGIDQWWETDPNGRIRRHLRDTPAGTKGALKELQPFYGVPRDKHRRLNLLVRRASIKFEDARGEPIYEGPAPTARIADRGEGDTYTA